ncbi:MAG: 7TM-DISM domain-containing protein, partial [Bacteroidota bacterium]
MYLIRVCLLLVMPLIACGQVRAQPVVAELTQSDQHDLTKHLQILEDPAGSLSFDQIQKKPLTAFRVFDAQLSLNDQSVYWLYLRVANRTNRRQWQWRLPFLKLTHGDFYYNSSAQKAFTKYKIGIFEKRGPNDGRLSVGE